MRGDYLIAAWHPEDAMAVATASRIEALLLREPDIQILRSNGLMVATQGAWAEQVAPSQYLVGEIFGSAQAGTLPRPGAANEAGFREYCSDLLSSLWGSYIALRHDPHAPLFLSVLAEPLGSRECLHWRHGGVTLLACDADHWLDRFPPATLAINLEDVAHLLHHPSQAAETAPLIGVAPLQPGAITSFTRSGTSARRLWAPRDHCAPRSAAGDPAALARIVDASVSAWSSMHAKPIVELSGGLDSAIVAASLAQAKGEGIGAFTFFSDSLAGDERRFSRAVADRLGLEPHEIAFGISAIDDSLLDGAAVGVRPGIGSTSFFHDRQLAAMCKARGADALFTGRGGDALFFQHPTPLVAQDGWPDGQKLNLERLEALARWCQTSIWRVAAAAWLSSVRNADVAGKRSPFCVHPSQSRPSTWAGSLEGVSQAKRMQIEAIAGDRNAFGPSRCAQVMRVIHPLLSQPIVEHALGQSLMALTEGRRDRAMARAAFANRLPAALIERRGKGSLSYFFGQTLARSVPILRMRLLEGALAQTGLVDRMRLEHVLDPDHLVQSSCYGEIIRLLIVERWMRGWQERLQQPREQPALSPPDYLQENRSHEHRSPGDLQGCR